MGGIALAHGFGQGDQGGAVVNGVDLAEHLAIQAENIADKNIDALATVALACADGAYLWCDAELGKEFFDGSGAQFGTGNAITLAQ